VFDGTSDVEERAFVNVVGHDVERDGALAGNRAHEVCGEWTKCKRTKCELLRVIYERRPGPT
jgi:hypothetical protein